MGVVIFITVYYSIYFYVYYSYYSIYYYLVLIIIYYLISLERTNTHKSEVFLLRISSGNVNTSGVATCWYSQIC